MHPRIARMHRGARIHGCRTPNGATRVARARYSIYLDAAPLAGVDWWWTDYGGCSSGGSSPMLWSNYVFDAHQAAARGERPLVLSRFGGLGNQRFPLGFSGDTFQVPPPPPCPCRSLVDDLFLLTARPLRRSSSRCGRRKPPRTCSSGGGRTILGVRARVLRALAPRSRKTLADAITRACGLALGPPTRTPTHARGAGRRLPHRQRVPRRREPGERDGCGDAPAVAPGASCGFIDDGIALILL